MYGDSVAKDTPILLCYPGGIITYRTIDNIYSFPEESKDKQCMDISKCDIKVWSDKGWTLLKKVIRHKTEKKMYRILTHTGLVDATEDHSLLLLDGKEVKPSEVKVGTKLSHNNLPIKESTITVDAEEAWVWGLFYAEGSCGTYIYTDKNGKTQKKSTWAINNQDHGPLDKAKEILNRVEPDFKFVIDNCMESSNIDKLTPRGSNHEKLVAKYREMFYHNKYKKVPDIMFQADCKARAAFMAGYYVGDGCKTDSSLRFDNKGKIGAAGLYYLAASIGFKVALQIRSDKEEIIRCNLSKQQKQRKHPEAIKKIINLGPCNDYVYDLETENHHFAAGVGRMVVHNTDSVMMDLNITDRKEVYKMGKKLEEEISGNAEKGIKGLFPPPLGMEFEKGMDLFCLKKKNYAAVLITEEGKLLTDDKDILRKGIVTERRDKAKVLVDMYNSSLRNILLGHSFTETFDLVISTIERMLRNELPVEDYAITCKMGANYKSKTYPLKLFGDYLRSIGIEANAGDRLAHVFVEHKDEATRKVYTGEKMRLVEQLKDVDNKEKIDVKYYIDKRFAKPINLLLSIGYKDDIAKLSHINYKAPRARKYIDMTTPMTLISKMLERGENIRILYDSVVQGLKPKPKPKLIITQQ